MAKRKIVFVIVEGPSDDEALGILFSKIYDKNSVYVHIMHGDITTQGVVEIYNRGFTFIRKAYESGRVFSR